MISRTTPIIEQIETSVREVPGWSPTDQLFALHTLALSCADKAGDILEVGSWCGRSAIALGMAAQVSGCGTVHCIDLFPAKNDWFRNDDGSYSFRVTIDGRSITSYDQQTVWAEPFARDIAPIYSRCADLQSMFRDNILAAGLDPVVRAFRGDLEMFLAAAPPGFRCRLAFLDGHHSYEALAADIAGIERCLVPGGWICFDDAFTSYAGVNDAISRHILASPHFTNAQQLTRKLFVAQRRG